MKRARTDEEVEHVAARDGNGSDLVDIPCPRCGEPISSVSKDTILRVRCLGVHCECGFTEDFEWINPDSHRLRERWS